MRSAMAESLLQSSSSSSLFSQFCEQFSLLAAISATSMSQQDLSLNKLHVVTNSD